MEWYSTLEQKIVPLAYKAAQAISSKVKCAQVEFENGSVSLIVPFGERVDNSQREAICRAVRSSLSKVVSDPARLKIRLRPEFRYHYTRHLENTRQAPNVVGTLHNSLQFTIPASAIVGMRHVYNLLFTQSKTHDFVATTALGGIPALTFLVRRLEDEERPSDQNEWGRFYSGLRDKYHLFAGLNWSETHHEQDLLFSWLASFC